MKIKTRSCYIVQLLFMSDVVYGANNFYMCKMPRGVTTAHFMRRVVIKKAAGNFMHCTCFSDFNLPRIYEEQYFAV